VTTFNTTPTSDFNPGNPQFDLVEGEKHDRLLQLVQRIKKSKDPELVLSGKKDFLDLVLTVRKPFDYELEMYDALLTEIFDNKLDYNVPGVTTTNNRERIGKDIIKKQQSLTDYL
jgi:hypothetical protein